MKSLYQVLSIAGSDCSGGAGIQADLKTFCSHGVYGIAVITAITAQNSRGISQVFPLPEEIVGSQIEAVLSDIRVDGIKIGMLANAPIINVTEEKLLKYQPRNVILDPVLSASDGTLLLEVNALSELKQRLFPIVDLITPNLIEAEILTGLQVNSVSRMKDAAANLYQIGVKAILIKGGHLPGSEKTDILFDGEKYYEIPSKITIHEQVHGTGCALSSAITALLAKGLNLVDAVTVAKKYVSDAMVHALHIGSGYKYLDHLYVYHT